MLADMEWLNYHHLLYFWSVAREGSLVAAATSLRVSPPSISAQIKALEESLGVKLFRKSGRRNILTEEGHIAFQQAEEIFNRGKDLVSTLRQRPTERPACLNVGVVDSLPKLVTAAVLKPVFALSSVKLVCREGKIDDLLAGLGAHRLDMVLADEPASSSLNYRAFNHRLGVSEICLCAKASLAARLKRAYPKRLDGAPFLLPVENTPLRRNLEQWFRARGIQPRVVAEIEDLALMKVLASREDSVVPVHEVVLRDAVEGYGLRRLGPVGGCRDEFFAITAERRITHPVIELLTTNARKLVFA
jgi:LysR family transcriptional activator of nhaA